MPELPEVETVRRGLAPVLEGALIEEVEVRRPDLRVPFPPRFAARLRGRTITKLRRRAKFLIAELDDGNALVAHLGMSGSFRIAKQAAAGEPVAGDAFHHPRSRLEAHDHVVFRLSNGSVVTFNDPRRFGLMDLVPIAELGESRHFKRLGVEPDAKSLDGPALAALMGQRKVALKVALCDQHLIAGLGNIYASEALWRARISPKRAARSLSGRGGADRAARLAKGIHEVLAAAIKAGGSSLRDHAQVDGELGEFQHHFAVYDREGEKCLREDGGTIRRIVQGGRSTFFCPVCQR
jgi:formamidopyrimidine-DNA glycosylase